MLKNLPEGDPDSAYSVAELYSSGVKDVDVVHHVSDSWICVCWRQKVSA
jgi:hypothetical protein